MINNNKIYVHIIFKNIYINSKIELYLFICLYKIVLIKSNKVTKIYLIPDLKARYNIIFHNYTKYY